MNLNRINIWFFILIGFYFISCKRVVVKVDSVPGNTPNGSNIYIAGNFNNWNPSDPNYILVLNEDSNYYVTLPNGFGLLKYKFTRGEWATEETDICGHYLQKRVYDYKSVDTITNSIDSWKDKEPLNCPTLTIVVTDLPENTPDDDEISIAGNFNNWDSEGDQYKLIKDSRGNYSVTIERDKNISNLEFKFTRGNLISAESDEFGNELPTRLAEFGKTDTIYTKIDNWEDLADKGDNYITVIIDEVPGNTPDNDDLFIVGNFNGWFPRDRNYIFNRTSKSKYFISLPMKRGVLEFKITRGDWTKQEMDEFGLVIDNRVYWYNESNEIHISVENWSDLIQKKEIVILIEKLTEITPENAKIYFASNLNGWNPGDLFYKFKKNDMGQYYFRLKISERHFEYKITRGSWDTETADLNGFPLQNKVFNYKGSDTIYEQIVNWKDQPIKEKNITFVITSIPKNTDENDDIYISGTFNGWDLGSNKYKLKEKDGIFTITLALNQNHIEYKFNRGNWRSVEGDRYGNEIENRVSKIQNIDTLFLKVKSWKDTYGKIKFW